jgi:hypothetical protein
VFCFEFGFILGFGFFIIIRMILLITIFATIMTIILKEGLFYDINDDYDIYVKTQLGYIDK